MAETSRPCALWASSISPVCIDQLERRMLFAAVTSLTLINADTDQPVPGFVLANNAMIDLAKDGRRLSVRANLDSAAGSVRFNYDGNPNYKIENVVPYAIAGDANNGSDYLPWTPSVGTHTLVVTPYSGGNATGTAGAGKTVTF